MKKVLVHNIWFRIFTPALYGILAYILILLVFDSLDQLTTNFLGTEAGLTILITYLLFGALRTITRVLEKREKLLDEPSSWILIQVSAGMLASVLISSLGITLYFIFYIGYSQFVRELVVFNIIFIITSWFYNLLYFSVVFLHMRNEKAIKREQTIHENLMHEFHGFQRDIRPELFYSAFESLLILIRTNKRSADSFIGKFSRVYRYIIEGKKQELIEVRRELEHLDNLLYLLNKKFNNKITLDIDIATSFMNYNLIPCSLQLVIEEAVFSNVIAEHSPMVLKLKSGDNNLMVSYTSFPRLLNDNKSEDMFRMNRAFDYYTNRKIESFSENGEVKIFIPILNLSEMEYIE